MLVYVLTKSYIDCQILAKTREINRYVEKLQKYKTLHKCVVNSAEVFVDVLSLTLSDVFWMLADTKYNSCRDVVRTDKSKINFTEFDEQLSVSTYSKDIIYLVSIYVPQEK